MVFADPDFSRRTSCPSIFEKGMEFIATIKSPVCTLFNRVLDISHTHRPFFDLSTLKPESPFKNTEVKKISAMSSGMEIKLRRIFRDMG